MLTGAAGKGSLEGVVADTFAIAVVEGEEVEEEVVVVVEVVLVAIPAFVGENDFLFFEDEEEEEEDEEDGDDTAPPAPTAPKDPFPCNLAISCAISS